MWVWLAPHDHHMSEIIFSRWPRTKLIFVNFSLFGLHIYCWCRISNPWPNGSYNMVPKNVVLFDLCHSNYMYFYPRSHLSDMWSWIDHVWKENSYIFYYQSNKLHVNLSLSCHFFRKDIKKFFENKLGLPWRIVSLFLCDFFSCWCKNNGLFQISLVILSLEYPCQVL